MSDDPKEPYTGPTTGIRIINSPGIETSGSIGAYGFDQALVVSDCADAKLGAALTATARDQPTPPPAERWWKRDTRKVIIGVIIALAGAVVIAALGLN